MRLPLIIAALFAATAASAQSWATKEACNVPQAVIDAGALAPDTLEGLRAAGQDYENGLGRLWQITGPDGQASYLWGTFHVNDPLILNLPDRALALIAQARVVAVETNFIYQSRADIQADIYRTGWVLEAPSDWVERRMSGHPQILRWIEDRLDGLGWGREALPYLTPVALAEILLGDPCNDFANGVLPIQDDRILMLGRIAGADTLSLETPERFAHYLSAPRNQQILTDMLRIYGSYLNPNATQAQRAAAFALYLQGEIGAMMAWDKSYVTQIFGPEGPDMLARMDGYLLDTRNRAFLESADRDLQAGGVFMAVGAFHLPGPDGLISLLRADGYQVTRIPLPGELAQ